MFRDRLLIISFVVSLFINTLAVCMIGGVTLRPAHFGAEPAKKNKLRPVRIGSYKPPKSATNSAHAVTGCGKTICQ